VVIIFFSPSLVEVGGEVLEKLLSNGSYAVAVDDLVAECLGSNSRYAFDSFGCQRYWV